MSRGGLRLADWRVGHERRRGGAGVRRSGRVGRGESPGGLGKIVGGGPTMAAGDRVNGVLAG